MNKALTHLHLYTRKEEFEDIKGAINIRISKKNRQHNGQKKEYKKTNKLVDSIKFNVQLEIES